MQPKRLTPGRIRMASAIARRSRWYQLTQPFHIHYNTPTQLLFLFFVVHGARARHVFREPVRAREEDAGSPAAGAQQNEASSGAGKTVAQSGLLRSPDCRGVAQDCREVASKKK